MDTLDGWRTKQAKGRPKVSKKYPTGDGRCWTSGNEYPASTWSRGKSLCHPDKPQQPYTPPSAGGRAQKAGCYRQRGQILLSGQTALHTCVGKVGMCQPDSSPRCVCVQQQCYRLLQSMLPSQPRPAKREAPSRELMIPGSCVRWGTSSLWLPVPK